MSFKFCSAAILLVLAWGSVAPTPARANDFEEGDFYLLTGGHPDPEIAVGILRIAAETGEVVSLGASNLSAHSFAYDPHRDRLLGFVHHGAGGLITVDVNGVEEPLSETLPGPWLIAPRGDGILYEIMFDTKDFYYIDRNDEMHPLLGPGDVIFTLSIDAYPKQFHYDRATNSLLVFGGTDDHLPGCPDEDQSCVLKVPLSADGTRVEGDVAAVQVEISSTWEIPVGVGRIPEGGVLWVSDTNSNDQEPRMQLLDPVAMASVPWASNGPYTGAAATNAGTFSSRLGRAVILDTYHNILRAFASGEAGDGIVVAEGVSDTGAGEVARLVEIWRSPFIGVGESPSTAAELSAMPNPFRASTRLAVRVALSVPITLAIYDVGGRLVRELARGELEAGIHDLRWDGRNTGGRQVTPGIYFARLDGPGVRIAKKLTLVR